MVRNCFGWGARLVAGGLVALAGLFVGRGPAFSAEPPKGVAAGAPVVFLKPTQRDGYVTPSRHSSALTGGGAVTVLQPAPDTLVVTLTGAAAAKANPFKPSVASVEAAVEQQFEVVFPAGVKPARLILEGRVHGLLRSEDGDCCLVSCADGKCGKSGSAEMVHASATVHCDSQALAGLNFPPKSVNGREALAVNLAEGPVCVPVGPGCHGLHLRLQITASQSRSLCPHIASAEFAPPPALPPTWIHSTDPFSGVDRSGMGFQVIVRVEPAPPVPPAAERAPPPNTLP
jgi:hypothetical protein